MDKTNPTSPGESRLAPLYQNISLWLLTFTLVTRIYMPGLTAEMGENSLIWLLAWVTVLFACVHASERAYWDIGDRLLTLAIGLMALVPFLTLIWAGDQIQAFYQSMTWLSDIALFFCICYWGRDKRWRRQIIAVVLACACLEIGYVIYQYFIGMPATRALVQKNPDIIKRLENTADFASIFYSRLYSPYIFGHFTMTNLLGGYLILFLPVFLALGRELWPDDKRRAALVLSAACGTAIALAMSGSRGSFLSLGLVAFFYSLRWLRRRFSASGMAVIGLGVLAASILYAVLAVFTHLLDAIGIHSLSLVMRIGYWRSGWEMLCWHPLLGVGTGNFHYYYYTYKTAWVEEVNKAHNCYWQWVTETGLLGVLALAFFLFTLWRLLKTNRTTAALTPIVFPEHDSRAFSGYLMPTAALFAFVLLWSVGYFFEYDSVRSWFVPHLSVLGSSTSQVLAALLASLMAVALMGLWFLSFAFFDNLSLRTIPGIEWGLLAFAFHNFLDIDYYDPGLSHIFWVLLALSVSARLTDFRRYRLRPEWKLLMLALVFASAAWLGLGIVPRWLHADSLKQRLTNLRYRSTQSKGDAQYRQTLGDYHQTMADALELCPWDHSLQKNQALAISNEIRVLLDNNDPRRLDWRQIATILQDAANGLDKLRTYRPHSASDCYYRARFYRQVAGIWRKAGQRRQMTASLQTATNEIEQAIRFYPDKAKFLILAGNLAETCGKKRAALDYYRHALYVDDVTSVENLAWVQKKQLLAKIINLGQAK